METTPGQFYNRPANYLFLYHHSKFRMYQSNVVGQGRSGLEHIASHLNLTSLTVETNKRKSTCD